MKCKVKMSNGKVEELEIGVLNQNPLDDDNITIEKQKKALELEKKLVQLTNLEPTKEWWEKFAEYQLQKMKRFASVRDTGESIQGTYKGLNR